MHEIHLSFIKVVLLAIVASIIPLLILYYLSKKVDINSANDITIVLYLFYNIFGILVLWLLNWQLLLYYFFDIPFKFYFY